MPSLPFSTADAMQLGHFVIAAYDLFAAGDPPVFTPPAGYTLVSKLYADDLTDGLPDFKVFGYIARSGADVVVAVRGTEDVLEWLDDFEFVKVRFPYVDAGSTEQGFTGVYSTLRTGPDSTNARAIDKLQEITADGSVATLRITGHSLGSTLATMLAIDVAGNGVFANPIVYTFASPLVGDKVFAGTYDNLVQTSWRIANVHDIVTQVPSAFAGYVHVDAAMPINSDDRSKHSVTCWHALATYLNTLDATYPIDAACAPQ
jgi:predicted lipase